MLPRIQNLLKSLEATRETFWNIHEETGKFLNLLIISQKYKTVLEIGTSNGYSGIWLAEALSHTKGHLYTIESNLKLRFHLATENFEKSGLSKHITQIPGHAPEAIPQKNTNPKKFDLVFFDATKHEHISYWKLLKNRINKGGTIITDNAISHKKDLMSFTKEVQKDKNFTSVILPIGTGLLIAIKN